MGEPRILLVVATLGERIDFLRETLTSIRGQSVASDVVIVAPAGKELVSALAAEFGAELIPDPGSLTGAINLGMASARAGHDYVNWLNDDDLLEPGSLAATVGALDADRTAVVAFGACRYIDPEGRELWISKAGPWAPRVLKWGPDLIPQPGMLVRRSAWDAVGGLDESFRFAFDLDLLLKLQKLGRLVDVRDRGKTLAHLGDHGAAHRLAVGGTGAGRHAGGSERGAEARAPGISRLSGSPAG